MKDIEAAQSELRKQIKVCEEKYQKAGILFPGLLAEPDLPTLRDLDRLIDPDNHSDHNEARVRGALEEMERRIDSAQREADDVIRNTTRYPRPDAASHLSLPKAERAEKEEKDVEPSDPDLVEDPVARDDSDPIQALAEHQERDIDLAVSDIVPPKVQRARSIWLGDDDDDGAWDPDTDEAAEHQAGVDAVADLGLTAVPVDPDVEADTPPVKPATGIEDSDPWVGLTSGISQSLRDTEAPPAHPPRPSLTMLLDIHEHQALVQGQLDPLDYTVIALPGLPQVQIQPQPEGGSVLGMYVQIPPGVLKETGPHDAGGGSPLDHALGMAPSARLVVRIDRLSLHAREQMWADLATIDALQSKDPNKT